MTSFYFHKLRTWQSHIIKQLMKQDVPLSAVMNSLNHCCWTMIRCIWSESYVKRFDNELKIRMLVYWRAMISCITSTILSNNMLYSLLALHWKIETDCAILQGPTTSHISDIALTVFSIWIMCFWLQRYNNWWI